jgi:signal transduction histidine kinase
MNSTAAAVAFFALGVTAFGTALLLLFNPRSAGVRWFALFQCSIMVWLFAQGTAFATGDWETWGPVVSAAVHLAPGLFLAFALIETGVRPVLGLGAIVLAVVLLPLDLASGNRDFAQPVLVAWYVVGWGSATWLFVVRMGKLQHLGAAQRRTGRWIIGLIALVFPVAIVSSVLGTGAHQYVMPLAMVWIQGLLFVGVAKVRFYDIEVRAARTGELAAAMAEQERMAVVGELSASLAHEIRNPLTGMRSLAQRLADDEVDEPTRRRYAEVILEEAGRVERLVANLLGIARRAPRAPRSEASTPVAPLFDDLALLVSGRARRGDVRVVVDGAGIEAPAGREPLAQVLLNLLLNALAHSPSGGTVSLTAAKRPHGVELSVRDEGPGIAAADREAVWEPFHTGGRGTGLGLAVVRRVAREEGWTAAIGDAPGGGAEIRVLIPDAAAS